MQHEPGICRAKQYENHPMFTAASPNPRLCRRDRPCELRLLTAERDFQIVAPRPVRTSLAPIGWLFAGAFPSKAESNCPHSLRPRGGPSL